MPRWVGAGKEGLHGGCANRGRVGTDLGEKTVTGLCDGAWVWNSWVQWGLSSGGWAGKPGAGQHDRWGRQVDPDPSPASVPSSLTALGRARELPHGPPYL